jgi:hypothetical protein
VDVNLIVIQNHVQMDLGPLVPVLVLVLNLVQIITALVPVVLMRRVFVMIVVMETMGIGISTGVAYLKVK